MKCEECDQPATKIFRWIWTDGRCDLADDFLGLCDQCGLVFARSVGHTPGNWIEVTPEEYELWKVHLS